MELSAAFAHAARLQQQGDLAGALGLYDRLLAGNSKLADAHSARAHILMALHRHEEAVAALSRLLALQPTSVPALLMRGQSRMALRQLERAFEDFDMAAALDPEAPYAQGTALYLAMRLCRWEGFDAALEAVLAGVDADAPVIKPFHLLALPASAAQQRKCAARFYRETVGEAVAATPAVTPAEKIKLGYFSADFRAHATAHLIAGLFRAHDRKKFEVIAFSLGGDARDAVQRQIAGSVDRWIDVSTMPDGAVAAKARELGIHIALDLNVYTYRQPSIFARRVAPIQVSYLGYAGTSAAACYDYLVGDSVVTPAAHAGDFSERIVTLPHTYQPTDFRTLPPLETPPRAALGLPEGSFVFCCFNDNFKIAPDVFDIWMRLLRKVEGSVLWLLAPGDIAARNLRDEAHKRGVAPERLVFAPRVSLQDYIARQSAADVFLDTFHYNAHTTASDALWANLPVVTLRGETFAGRVAASLVTAAGVPELVVENAADYEALALQLALEPEMLGRIKKKLAENKMTCPLFDTARYARNIKSAYAQMWARHTTGQALDHVTVVEP